MFHKGKKWFTINLEHSHIYTCFFIICRLIFVPSFITSGQLQSDNVGISKNLSHNQIGWGTPSNSNTCHMKTKGTRTGYTQNYCKTMVNLAPSSPLIAIISSFHDYLTEILNLDFWAEIYTALAFVTFACKLFILFLLTSGFCPRGLKRAISFYFILCVGLWLSILFILKDN